MRYNLNLLLAYKVKKIFKIITPKAILFIQDG